MRYPLLMLSFAILQLSCTDLGTELNPVAKDIAGSWLWVRTYGGFGGTTILPDPGEETVDSFYLTGDWQRRRNSVLQYSGRYTLVDQRQGTVLQLSDLHAFNGAPAILVREWVVKLDGNTLRLLDTYADGWDYTYARVNPVAFGLHPAGSALDRP